jgi:hypothetical protein
VREQAEKLARHTVGMVDLRNELKVGLSGSIEQTSYASASLAPPTRLDGGDLAEPLPLPSVAMRETPSAALGAFIEPLTGSSLSPVVPPLSVAMMPPARHRTVEQQVAKPAAEPEVLPSGQRLWAGTGRKATIPAPPSSNRSVLSSPPLAGNVGVLPSSAESPSVLSSDRLTDQKSADVAALLLKDPRARALTFTLRQSEVRLAGSVAKPEDLFALADLLDALPGIDFVSFDDVQFQIP